MHHVPEAEAQPVCQPGNFECNTASSGTVEISGIFLVLDGDFPGDKTNLIAIKILKGKEAKNINLNAVGRGESPRGKRLGKGKWHVRVSMVFADDEPL